jgi:hypothetical protein
VTEEPLGPFNGVCVDRPPGTGVASVVFGGIVSRFDTGSLAPVGDPLRPWTDASGLARMADTVGCAQRPGRDEIAFDAGPNVEVWSLAGAGQRASLATASPVRIADVRFSADGRRLAALSADGTLTVWDTDGWRPVGGPSRVLEPGIYSRIVAFRGSDQIIVRDSTVIRVWDIDRRAAVVNADLGHGISQQALAADGGTLLVWGKAGLTRVPLRTSDWVSHLCRIVGRDLTSAERRSMPAGSPDGQVCPAG